MKGNFTILKKVPGGTIFTSVKFDTKISSVKSWVPPGTFLRIIKFLLNGGGYHGENDCLLEGRLRESDLDLCRREDAPPEWGAPRWGWRRRAYGAWDPTSYQWAGDRGWGMHSWDRWGGCTTGVMQGRQLTDNGWWWTVRTGTWSNGLIEKNVFILCLPHMRICVLFFKKKLLGEYRNIPGMQFRSKIFEISPPQINTYLAQSFFLCVFNDFGQNLLNFEIILFKKVLKLPKF